MTSRQILTQGLLDLCYPAAKLAACHLSPTSKASLSSAIRFVTNGILNQLFQTRRHTLQTVSVSRNSAAIIGR
jgi:hypothetical protein